MSFFGMYGSILLAALFGGSAAGLGGFYVIGMRMPFLAVCMAHAAFAGAIFGELLGVGVGASAFAGALAGCLLLVILLRDRQAEPGARLGVVFSLMLGLAFLGIGLHTGPHSTALGLMWGSLLFVRTGQIVVMAAILLIFILFALLFHARLKVLLFDRHLAMYLFAEPLLFAALLILLAAVITINLQTVGGILLFSLICNPAVAAAAVARSFDGTAWLSAVFGAASAAGGFFLALALDVPVGACIVLVSTGLVAVCLAVGRRRRHA